MYFRNEYAFLSNMFKAEIRVNGLVFSCAEACFQSFKTEDKELRKKFQNISGYEAKKLGKSIKLRPDWNEIRLEVMEAVLKAKFKQHPELMVKLIAINEPIVEHNTWHDEFWGVCDGLGKNNLGIILDKIRVDAQKAYTKKETKIVKRV